MEFREANAKDISLIQDLARRSWKVAYKSILSAEQIHYMLDEMYSDRALEKSFSEPNSRYVLLYDSLDAPLGFLGFEHHYEPLTTKLHRIYLLPESQGKGVGSEALRFLKKQSLDSGDSRIILNVNKNNGAKSTYERNGFTVYGQGVFEIGNSFVMDDYLMQCLL